jgi:hypothetical protein
MADELRIGLERLLRKAHIEHDADFLREGVRALSQALMELEVEEHLPKLLATSVAPSAPATGIGAGILGWAP